MEIISTITATRYHDFSYGHRVAGHENKCAKLHGHNGRVHFTIAHAPRRQDQLGTDLDKLGRILDFGVIKLLLCQWVEEHWDHRFLAWEKDPLVTKLYEDNRDFLDSSLVFLPYNPTAENMARYLLETIGPQQLRMTGCTLIKVVMEETRKCQATAQL